MSTEKLKNKAVERGTATPPGGALSPPDLDGDGVISPWERCVWFSAIILGILLGRTIY